MNQTTSNQLGKARLWLETSSKILSRIETALDASPRDVHRIGLEWAGALSRLKPTSLMTP